jgi:hypothetical protein
MLFGGSVVKSNPYRNFGNRKPRHRWVTSTFNAADALKQMMPYFKNKMNVVAIALDFQKTVVPYQYKVSDEDQEFRQYCKKEIMRLNALN